MLASLSLEYAYFHFSESHDKSHDASLSSRTVTMQLRNGSASSMRTSPTFDPHLDIATVVFSHVQCVKTRVNLALVSKLWRDASKPAAAYPLTFDLDALPDVSSPDILSRSTRVIRLMDNDEALSLPYERVVGLLGEAAKHVCNVAARRGSVRLLKWARENNVAWSAVTCHYAASNGHLPALKYLHENGCPWDSHTCWHAAIHKHWDCLQYAVDNKCPGWEDIRRGIREAPPIDVMTHNRRLRSCFICYLDILISIDSFTLNDPRARTRP